MRAMLIAATFATASAALMTSMQVAADDHNDYILDITQIEVKMGHNMQFRDGVKAYMECYAAAGGENSWSTWGSVDGKGLVYHVVSQMDGWAKMDESDEAGMSCWPTIREQVQPHMESVKTMFAKRMPDWSPDEEPDDTTVVRLHNFNVDDGRKFRAAIGTVTGIMKASEYAHMATWYDVLGGEIDDPEYFAVASYKDFAAMDEERAGPYGTMKEHAGEDTARIVWDQYLDSLEDGEGYWSNLLRYDEELSHGDD